VRYIIAFLFLIGISFYLSIDSKQESFLVTPNFLLEDPIIQNDQSYISVINQSFNSVSVDRIKILKSDYIKIWNHLDHLHNTNDIVIGKRYYSEAFFKQLVNTYFTFPVSKLHRTSFNHQVHIKAFTPDGLICTLLDSNILIKYQTPQYYFFDTINVAMVLLYEGENWRVDAIQQF
jgi:hypothetical protein